MHSDAGIQIAASNGTPAKALDWFPVVCDLCGGDPQCVRFCDVKAQPFKDGSGRVQRRTVLAVNGVIASEFSQAGFTDVDVRFGVPDADAYHPPDGEPGRRGERQPREPGGATALAALAPAIVGDDGIGDVVVGVVLVPGFDRRAVVRIPALR